MLLERRGVALRLVQGEEGFVIHHEQDGGKVSEPVRKGDGYLTPREFEAIAERLAREILASKSKSASDKGNGLISRSMIGMAQQLVTAAEAIKARKAAKSRIKLVPDSVPIAPMQAPEADVVTKPTPKIVLPKLSPRKKRRPRKKGRKDGLRSDRRDKKHFKGR